MDLNWSEECRIESCRQLMRGRFVDNYYSKSYHPFYELIRYAIYKVKRVKSLFLTKHHAMKAYWEVEVQLHSFLNWALDGRELSASRPGRLNPGKESPVSI
jgi:hypothetical protein